jgi:hypothetical protein
LHFRASKVWVAHPMSAATNRLAGLLVLLALLAAASGAAGSRSAPPKAAAGAGLQGSASGGAAAFQSRALLEVSPPHKFPTNLRNFTGPSAPACRPAGLPACQATGQLMNNIGFAQLPGTGTPARLCLPHALLQPLPQASPSCR